MTKPLNIKESASDFFRKYLDIINEAQKTDEKEQLDELVRVSSNIKPSNDPERRGQTVNDPADPDASWYTRKPLKNPAGDSFSQGGYGYDDAKIAAKRDQANRDAVAKAAWAARKNPNAKTNSPNRMRSGLDMHGNPVQPGSRDDVKVTINRTKKPNQ